MLLLLLPLGFCNDVVAAAKGARRSRPAEGRKRIEKPAENSLLQSQEHRETRRVQRSSFSRRRSRSLPLPFSPFIMSDFRRDHRLRTHDLFVDTFVGTLPLFNIQCETGAWNWNSLWLIRNTNSVTPFIFSNARVCRYLNCLPKLI